MNQIIEQLLHLQLQSKIFHWQTQSYAQHNAFGQFYDKLDDLIDRLVEVYQGRYGDHLQYNKTIALKNMGEVDIPDALNKAAILLENDFQESCNGTDSDLLNIRDEILSEVNKLKYLLTLE